MPETSVYLDHAATTPLDPEVLEAMRPYFDLTYGNPSSVHRWGQRAEGALSNCRDRIARLLNCQASEILFTSGGSESDNLAIAGTAFARHAFSNADTILTTPVEHEAVLKTAERLDERHGFNLELLATDETGQVDPDELQSKITSKTAVVSIIHGNNEIGTLNRIAALGAICREHGVPFHTDAVQSAGQLPIDVDEFQVDLLSIGAHKLYGPKGIGALYIREGTSIDPLFSGGGQERGLRPGTENVPLIVGMTEAIRITVERFDEHINHYKELRSALISGVLQVVPDVRLTGHPTDRLPNHASFAFLGIEANALLAALDLQGFACSSGSACKTGEPEPSRVLTALGLEPEWASGSLRVTVGRSTTMAQIDSFLDVLPDIIERQRASPPLAQ